jgi:hypothetical protein
LNKRYFLSDEEYRFFEVLCETIVPEGADSKKEPGALTVGGMHYIDSSLSDFPKERQDYFREAVRLLNELCIERFSNEFSELRREQRDEALKGFYSNHLTREKMFDLRSIVLEAFYSDYRDPEYAGTTAWEFVDFGGKRISDVKKDWRFIRIWKDHSTDQK